jgi:hypothetical protein
MVAITELYLEERFGRSPTYGERRSEQQVVEVRPTTLGRAEFVEDAVVATAVRHKAEPVRKISCRAAFHPG